MGLQSVSNQISHIDMIGGIVSLNELHLPCNSLKVNYLLCRKFDKYWMKRVPKGKWKRKINISL